MAVLVLSASSGATVVLHRCQMEIASCCSPKHTANNDGCDQSTAAQTGLSFKSDFTCHVDVVVGGLALKQALLEKENRSEANIAVIPNICSLSSCTSIQTDSYTHELFLGKAVSPPSVDRYVLNGSFLI
jgi:hypothetical protein